MAGQKVVLFGDSNTANSNWAARGYDPAKKWSSLLAAKGWNIVDKGVGGNDTNEARSRFSADVLSQGADACTIMFGTNDAVLDSAGNPKVDLATFETNIRHFVNHCAANNIKPILMTCIPIVDGSVDSKSVYYSRHSYKLYQSVGGARANVEKYNEVTRKVANYYGLTLIDNYANFVLKSGGSPTNDFKLWDGGLIEPDGVHQTERGADTIFYSVNTWLGRLFP